MEEKPFAEKRILLFTGDGKGKTTAAAGTALRAIACGKSVRLAQFIKKAPSGELTVLERFPEVEILRDGLGFLTGDLTPHKKCARRLWETLQEKESAHPSWLLILDEICLAVAKDFISTEEALDCIRARPAGTVSILTGRNAPQAFMDAADTATEMRCAKHGYTLGIPAWDGVEK
jgi:cob(I)alamin adenosyltransferase